MPYIKIADRQRLEGPRSFAKNAGELNYELTKVVKRYIGLDFNYQKLNDAIGALEGCKLELYRRIVIPYEDKKIKEHGDVF